MPINHVADAPPNVWFEQSDREKLTKLVRKLRWSGFEEEADQIQLILSGVAQERSFLTCRMADLRLLRVVVKTLEELSSGITLAQPNLGSGPGAELSVARLATKCSTLQ